MGGASLRQAPGESPPTPTSAGTSGAGIADGANIGELWAAQNPYSGWAASGRRSTFEFVLPRQQIRRDLDEARRVAHLFQHLEHIDDELPVSAGGVAAGAFAHRRLCRGALLPGLMLAVAGAILPRLEPLSSEHHFVFDFDATMFLLHTAAGFLTYVTMGPLLRLMSVLVLRFARVHGSWSTAEAVYLNGMLLREERVACSVFCLWAVNFSWWSSPSVTRELLSRPCKAVLLLALTNGLRKVLEFAFLTRRLRDRFQSDVLSNAFERAALQRLAALASECKDGPSKSAALQALPVLPDVTVGEPHAFERHTAEMLKAAFGLRDPKALQMKRSVDFSPSRLASKPSVVQQAALEPGGLEAGWPRSRAASKASLSGGPPSRSPSKPTSPKLSFQSEFGVPPTSRRQSATAFKTPSTTVFVMQTEDHCAEIEEEARRLFWRLLGRPWSSTGLPPPDFHDAQGRPLDGRWEELEVAGAGLLRSDLGHAMPPEDADRTWQLLTAKSGGGHRRASAGCGSVSEDEFVQAVRGTFERFHMLAATVKDYAAIWLVFSNLLAAVQVVVSGGVVLAMVVPWKVLRTICISLPTAFLGFSFIFGSMLREVFESLVLILLVQPYDIGDRISLPDGEETYRHFTVQKINILTTEARDSSNQCVYLKNSALFQESRLMNLGRSLNAVVELSFEIPASQLSSDICKELETFIQRFITYKAVNWVPTYLRSFTSIEDGYTHCDLSGGVTYRFRLMHRKSWQYIREIRHDATSVLYAVLEEMRRIGLDFRLTSKPVQVEGLPHAQDRQFPWPFPASSSSARGSRRSSGVLIPDAVGSLSMADFARGVTCT